MGDMADMLIEQGIAQMTDQDYEPDDCYIRDARGFARTYRNIRRCKYCGTDDLQWTQTENGWRMIDQESGIHSCGEYRKAKRHEHIPDSDPFNGDDGPDPAQWGE